MSAVWAHLSDTPAKRVDVRWILWNIRHPIAGQPLRSSRVMRRFVRSVMKYRDHRLTFGPVGPPPIVLDGRKIGESIVAYASQRITCSEADCKLNPDQVQALFSFMAAHGWAWR